MITITTSHLWFSIVFRWYKKEQWCAMGEPPNLPPPLQLGTREKTDRQINSSTDNQNK